MNEQSQDWNIHVGIMSLDARWLFSPRSYENVQKPELFVGSVPSMASISIEKAAGIVAVSRGIVANSSHVLPGLRSSPNDKGYLLSESYTARIDTVEHALHVYSKDEILMHIESGNFQTDTERIQAHFLRLITHYMNEPIKR